MILCLVTDRRRLARAVGAKAEDAAECLVDQVRGAVAGGVDFIQVREPDLEAHTLCALVRRIIASVPGASTRLIVNDRLDVALVCGAAGVHLKENAFTVTQARALCPSSFVIGRSIHGAEAARGQARATYLMAGTVKPTTSKLVCRYLGFDGLAEVVRAAEGESVVAIGGLSLSDAPQVADAGAKGMAAIGAFIPDGDLDLAGFVKNQAEKLRLAFDSGTSVT